MVERFMYVVSPEYLMPIVEQSKDYSFKVKGFSDCTRAYNNLAGTNQANILGYILVYEEVPDNSTDLVEFINFVNLIGTKYNIVLVAFRDTDGFEQLMDFLELDNITFMYYNDFEVLTDLVIRRNLFGSILVRKFRPYRDIDEPLNLVTTYNQNSNIVPVLPKDILVILSPIIKYDSSQHTIDNDVVVESYKGSIICYLRINRIKRMFDEEVDFDGMMSRINNTEGIDKVLYSTVVNMICSGL